MHSMLLTEQTEPNRTTLSLNVLQRITAFERDQVEKFLSSEWRTSGAAADVDDLFRTWSPSGAAALSRWKLNGAGTREEWRDHAHGSEERLL